MANLNLFASYTFLFLLLYTISLPVNSLIMLFCIYLVTELYYIAGVYYGNN